MISIRQGLTNNQMGSVGTSGLSLFPCDHRNGWNTTTLHFAVYTNVGCDTALGLPEPQEMQNLPARGGGRLLGGWGEFRSAVPDCNCTSLQEED